MKTLLTKGLAAASLAIMGAGVAGSAIAQDTGDPQEGRRIFNSYCFLCHGANGIGAGILAEKLDIIDQVADLTQDRYSSMEQAELAGLIAGYDRQESAMPKWGEVLDDDALANVASYVKALGPQTSYEIGKTLYFRHCAACHGSDGGGGGALAKQLDIAEMPDLSSEEYRSKPAEEVSQAIAGHDSLGGHVQNFGEGFTERALTDLSAYIVKYSPSSLAVTGNAENGEAIFRTNCVGCHGATGKGDGVLASLLDAPVIDLTDPSRAEVSDMQLVHNISRGKGTYMPAWFGELNQYEIRDVAAYVRSLSH